MSSTKHIRVSYLITTRNRCEHLAKTLDNVREFITSEDELIIFDAASTDETQLVAEKNKDIISLFVSEPDKGEAHGFNKGILASRGKYIKFLTDDDYFYPDVMRRSIEILEENPEIDVLISGGTTWDVNEKGEKSNPMERRLPENFNLKNGFIDDRGTRLSGQGILLRSSVLPILGLLSCDKKMVDIDYFTRIIRSELVCRYHNECLYDHFIWEKSGGYNLHQNDIYWIELAEALFKLGKWKSLLMLQNKWIISSLHLPQEFISMDSLVEILKVYILYPKSKKVSTVEKIFSIYKYLKKKI